MDFYVLFCGTFLSEMDYFAQSPRRHLQLTNNSFISGGTGPVGTQHGWTYKANNDYLTLTIDKPFTLTFNTFSGDTSYMTPYIYYNDSIVLNSWTAFSQSYSAGTVKLGFYMKTQLTNGGVTFNFSILC